jgi:CBS domain-containing protein
MTPAPLVTIPPNASSKEAAGLMIKHNIRRLPVVENGALVGIVTCKDLLRCVE